MHRKLLISLLISLLNLINGQIRAPKDFGDITLDYKSTRTFTCRGSGEIRSRSGFKWYRGSTEITNSAGLISLNARGDTMTILKMSRSLAGDYQCVVYGTSNQEDRSNIFTIGYRGAKPGEVQVPKATAVRGSEATEVVVSWSLPRNLGFNLASDILYTVKMCLLPGLTSCGTKNTESLRATMSVDPDKQYSVIITTSTKSGVDGSAASFIYTTPLCSSSEYRCPGEKKCIRNTTASTQVCDGSFDCRDKSDEDELCTPPKIVKLIEPEDGEVGTASSIIVRWEKPASVDRITGYQILLNTGFVERFNADGNMVEREIRNLSPNTEYTATIRARNPSGYGKSSTEKFMTDKGPVGYAIDIETYSKKYIQFMKWKPPTQTGGVSLKELIYTISWNKKGEDNIRFSQNITGGRLEYNIPMDNYKNRDNFDYSFSVINGAKVGGNKTVNNTFVYKPREPFEFLSIEVFRTYIVLAWPSHVPPDIVYGYTLVLNGTVTQLASDVTDYNITGLELDTYYKIDLTRDNGDRDDQSITTTEITKNCAPGEFQCKNGECLKTFGQVCNSFNDCSDGSDEHHDYPLANCKQPGEVDFNITAQYKGLKIHLLNLNGSLTATVVVNINGRTGDLIKLPNGQLIRGIERKSQFGALVIQDQGFSSSIVSTVYVYGNSLSGNGPILSKTARTLGPIALPPELIENGPQFLEIEFPGLPGINELSLESYTIQYKHTNDNNLLNKTEIIKTSARPLKRLFRGLEYNTTYSFRYKVEDKDGESDYSPWVDFSTTARALPGEPQNVQVKPRRSEIDLLWEKAPGNGILGYIIQYKESSSRSWRNAKTENVTGTFHTIKSLSPVTRYDVRIAARNDKGHGEFVEDGTKTDENVCPGYDWKYYAPHCYYRGPFGLDGKTFDEARSECLKMGADLVSIHSGEENNNVLYEVKRKPVVQFSYFNGLQRTSKSDFTWSDGTSFSYAQVDQNQNYDPRRQCVVMLTKDDNTFAWAYERCNNRPGFICKRKNVNDEPLSLKLAKNGYNSLTFELPRTSLNRNSKYIVEIVDMATSKVRTMNVTGSSEDQEFTVKDLAPDSEYSISVREDFQGLGPKSKVEKFTTRVFISPSVVEKVEAEPVQHAESRQQKLSWEYGDLGDSNEEDVYVRVKYCTPKRCRTMDFNGTSGVLEKLSRKTKYNYTVQVLDRTFMKFSKVSVAKEFTTEEKDTCKDGEWLCTGGWKCISNDERCDNVFDCPSDIIGTSADEQKGAGCKTPKRIKINGTIGGPNFLRLYWEAPAKDQRVRGYTVEVNDGEAEYFVEGNRTSFRVSYLPRGSLVTYTISAFNPSGDGALLRGSKRLANASVATSAARDVIATSDIKQINENTQRVITWKIPEKLYNNDPVTVRYDIQICHTDKGEKICKQESVTNQLQYTVQSLKPSKNYTVVVTATNEYKQSSPPSNVARFITTLCNRDQYECKIDGKCVAMNMTCDGVKNCDDAADEKAVAGCKLAPNVVIKEDTISDKSITIKYEKLKVLANKILFTLSKKDGNDFLQEEQVKGEDTLEDGTVTFTKGVKADTEYIVKATVVNYVGQNDGIELTISTPEEDALPSKPRDVTFTKVENLESSSVEVKWETPSITGGVSKSDLKFEIKYCATIDDEIKCDEMVTEAGSTSLVVKDLKANTKYRFEVTAHSSDTEKGKTAIANYKTLMKDTCKDKSYYRCPIKCLNPEALCDGVIDCIDKSDETIAAKCAAPKKVREVSAEATWNALKVSWEPPVNHALQYHLTFQCTVKGEKSPVVKTSIDAKKTSYTFGDLTDTRDVATCEVSIVPENFVGVGPESKGIFKTSPLGKPSKPKNKKITKVGGYESSRVELEWDEPSDLGNANPKELKYKVEWCEEDDKSSCKDKNVDGTKVMLKELESGKEYDVTVTPINPLGELGKPLKLKFETADKDTLPSAPTNIKISKRNKEEHAFVEWTAPKDKSGLKEEEIKYKLIYCVQPGKECVEVDLDAGVKNHTLVNLKSANMYEIRVAALGRSGVTGDYSDNFIHRTGGSASDGSDGLHGWEIALIVIGLILLILIIVIAVAIYMRRRSAKGEEDAYEKSSGNEKSKMNDGYQDDKV